MSDEIDIEELFVELARPSLRQKDQMIASYMLAGGSVEENQCLTQQARQRLVDPSYKYSDE